MGCVKGTAYAVCIRSILVILLHKQSVKQSELKSTIRLFCDSVSRAGCEQHQVRYC
jgi:hypothetical protein